MKITSSLNQKFQSYLLHIKCSRLERGSNKISLDLHNYLVIGISFAASKGFQVCEIGM